MYNMSALPIIAAIISNKRHQVSLSGEPDGDEPEDDDKYRTLGVVLFIIVMVCALIALLASFT